MDSAFIWKFIKFGIVGFSGVFVDFGVTYFGKEVFRLNKYVANSLGFLTAVVSNYTLNRVWTFHSQDPDIAWQFGKFFAVALVGLAMNNGIIYALNERYGWNFYASKLVATALVVLWNFGANAVFTFV